MAEYDARPITLPYSYHIAAEMVVDRRPTTRWPSAVGTHSAEDLITTNRTCDSNAALISSTSDGEAVDLDATAASIVA